MNNDIVVSVMITYYNQKQYIKDSLGSVLSQKTNFKYEVLCGDDGSSDGTYEELLKWQEKYPGVCKVFQMPRETGVKYEPIVRASNNRHNLLKHAEGKYVTILDGDDYYTDDNKLQAQADILENHPDCAACCHPMRMVWEDCDRAPEFIGKLSDRSFELSNKVYWSALWLPAEAFLFRNYYKGKEDAINKDFFDDNLITIYFIKYGNIIYTPKSMVDYRQHSESSWNSRSDIQKAYVNMLLYQESKKILPEMKWQCFSRCRGVWRVFYDHRKEDLKVDNGSRFVVTEKMYLDSLRYRTSSKGYQLKYILKYFVPCHMGKVFSVFFRLQKLTYRYL